MEVPSAIVVQSHPETSSVIPYQRGYFLAISKQNHTTVAVKLLNRDAAILSKASLIRSNLYSAIQVTSIAVPGAL